MARNEQSSTSGPSSAVRPTIALPPRSSAENLFTGPGASPGPMSLVSSFFAENDPGSDCHSFSQLLAGAMDSPAPAVNPRHEFPADRGGGGEFRFQQSRPTGLVVSNQQGMFTIPAGLSPASLLDSPGFFPPSQGSLGMSHQQMVAQVTAHAQMQSQREYPSISAAPASSLSQLRPLSSCTSLQQQMAPPNILKESSDISQSEQRSQPLNFPVDKPADDGYNWRKYGQKQVKGSEYPRSYYKCTHPKCPVKKKVERSFDGQITEIIYKGQHNHTQPSKHKNSGNPNGDSDQGNYELGSEGVTGNPSKISTNDQESSQATPEHISGLSDSEEVGDGETGPDGRDNDEPESKRRNVMVQNTEPAASHRTVTEPRIIVQTTSEVDLLDDGYRWRKYGQKVVKGNPYPRSYYKCTSQGCNVRKHVERAASDPKAVVTTYEGRHNHDVPAAKSSSHNTANAASQLRPQTAVINGQGTERTNFGIGDQQSAALLKFKQENMT